MTYPNKSHQIEEILGMDKCLPPGDKLELEKMSKGNAGRHFETRPQLLDGPFVDMKYLGKAPVLEDIAAFDASFLLANRRVRGVGYEAIGRQNFRFKKRVPKGWHLNVCDPNLPTNDPRPTEENVAEQTVQRIFHDAQLTTKRKHQLKITPERAVKVDYFAEARRPIALQILRTRTDVSGSMEKWGFRWHELKQNYQGLAPIMLYDRDTQLIDPYSRHIGDTECELFCGYDETDRIHETLEELR